MVWQGKALGALIGVFAAGPVGALFGTFIGHLFDVQAESTQGEDSRRRSAGSESGAGPGSVLPRHVPDDGPSRQGRRPGVRGRDPRGARDDERVPSRRARSAARDRIVHAGQEPRFSARTAAARAAAGVPPASRPVPHVRADPAADGVVGRQPEHRQPRSAGAHLRRARRLGLRSRADGSAAAHAAGIAPPGAAARSRSRRGGVRSSGRDRAARPTPRSRRPIAG